MGEGALCIVSYDRGEVSRSTNYSAFDRVLLAAYIAVRHFAYLLEGRDFVLFTDHKALVGALARKSTPLSPRQSRHLTFIAEFTTNIQHIFGEANIVAIASAGQMN